MDKKNAPYGGVIEKLTGCSDRMTISQAVVFLERQGLSITKTMIQNYVRVNALTPPVDGRRYTRNHILMIILIDRFKSVCSLEEIGRLLSPYAQNAINGENPDMFDVYKKFCELFDSKTKSLREIKSENPLLSAAAEAAACKNFISEALIN